MTRMSHFRTIYSLSEANLEDSIEWCNMQLLHIKHWNKLIKCENDFYFIALVIFGWL